MEEEKFEKITTVKQIDFNKKIKSEEGPDKTKTITLIYDEKEVNYKIEVKIKGSPSSIPRFFDELKYGDKINLKFYIAQQKIGKYITQTLDTPEE